MKNVFTDAEQSIISLYLEKWICPLKYAYKTEKWAYSWDEIEKSRAVDGGNFAEYELLINNAEIYLQELWNPKEIALFDFWSGTWDTVKGILLKMLDLGIVVHYHAFDISPEILKLCELNLWNLWKNYTFNSTTLDFESSNLVNILSDIRAKYNNIPVMGALLWSTIWNFDSMERIITNITDAFRISDRFIVWIEKVDVSDDRRKQQVVNTYDHYLVNDLTFSTLEYFGVKKNEWIWKVIFNNRNAAIEMYFEFTKHIEIKVWEKNIKFSIWDRVKLAQSKKLNEAQFAQMFLDLDLRIASMRTNEKNTFIEMMLSPKKY
jgi:uncharacterized SAM-dependent methyltransferase